MAIDPKTWLEIAPKPTYTDTVQQSPTFSTNVTPTKIDLWSTTPTNGWITNAWVPQLNLDKINEYRKALWTWPALEHTTTPQAPISTVSNVSGGLSNLKIATPVTSPVTPPTTWAVTVPPVTTTTWAVKPDYISQADWDKIQTEGTKNIKDTYSAYNIAKGQYEQNKNYYVNFDEKNNQFSNVLNSLQTAQSQNQNAPITDAQYQNIASQYGLTIDQVKNPLKIFSDPNTGLKMTDEGTRKLWVAGAQQNITDAEKNYQRTQEDLKIKAQQTQDQFQQQVDDVQKQLTRNIDWMNAQGAWSGANKSSGYVQGIQNVKADWEQTISRLQALASAARVADEKSVARLTEDFNTGITRAKTALDDQMKEVNQSAGLQLAGLTEQYGLGNKTLTTQLDNIMQDMDTKTASAQAQYINNLKSIQDITSTNIEQYSKLQELTTAQENKRSNELLANNGAILQNTSLTTLSEGVKTGTISPQKYADLKSYMLSGIQTALGKLGTITEPDTHTIEHLLETGSTPAQVIAKMVETWRFKAVKTVEKTIDLWDRIMVSYSDGSTESIRKWTEAMSEYQRAQLAKEEKPFTVASWSYIYDPTTKQFTSPSWEPLKITPAPTGNIVGIKNTWGWEKNIKVDEIAQPSLISALNQMWLGNYVVWSQQYRTPEQQAELVKKWKSWTMDSKHMTGLAIDLYANSKLDKPTQAQIQIMNANWWFQPKETIAKWDYGHFEYRGIDGQIADIPKSKKDTATLISSGFNEVPASSNYSSKVVSGEWDVLAKLKPLWENEKKSVESWLQVKDALPGIKSLFDRLDTEWKTWPVAGRYSKSVWAVYDTDIQTVNSFLNSVLPSLARWVYWEVWVLTDNDIANYRKTLADFTQTTEARNRVLWELQNKLNTSLPRKIQWLEKQNYNVEGYRWVTEEPQTTTTTTSLADKIKSRLKK